jgi:glutamine synthetase
MKKTILSFKTPTDLLKFSSENEIRFINFNATDMRGRMMAISVDTGATDAGLLEEGIYTDGSSFPGWRNIDKSDLILKPDLSRACIDPFAAQKTLKVFCDLYDPVTGKSYIRDPRSVAKAAEFHLKKSGIADTVYFGPEVEFFIFGDVRVHGAPHHMGFQIDSDEGPYNSGKEYPTGNLGHRPREKGGYCTESPIDSLSDIRGEMLTVMGGMGIPIEKHHHEVSPGQCELGFVFSTLIESADNIQLYKYVVQNVAHSYGKTATFMPKPIFGENGSGMHVHQSLWKSGKPLFAGSAYAGLSDTALHYIGGIIRHARALNAFTNPSTNSYKRLVPGYEAPVLLAYSSMNRSASCRIPYASGPKGKRVEVRFPDPLANPYLALAAMLMAGLDGIENKIDPGEAIDRNLYELEPQELKKIPNVCGSLREALAALDKDREFLLKGDVFNNDLIDAHINLKMKEVETTETTPHPAEYLMYYSG